MERLSTVKIERSNPTAKELRKQIIAMTKDVETVIMGMRSLQKLIPVLITMEAVKPQELPVKKV